MSLLPIAGVFPMSEAKDSQPEAEPMPARQTYQSPKLHTFGLLADITRRVGTTGLLADKSGGGTNKTM